MKVSKSNKDFKEFIFSPTKRIWEITCFSSITIFLGLFLTNKGWEPIDRSKINIQGAINTPQTKVFESMKIDFPIAILKINPKQIELNLLRNLPIQAVAVNRKIAPLGLDIQILERKPIALAIKANDHKEEKGMIDKNGVWIPFFDSTKPKKQSNQLLIKGWTETKKVLIAEIYRHKDKLGSPLKKIIFKPNGEISLQTEDFHLINLGARTELLRSQMEIIGHLSTSLSSKFKEEGGTILDIQNPSKPKLFFSTR